jgi:hypothetical protein
MGAFHQSQGRHKQSEGQRERVQEDRLIAQQRALPPGTWSPPSPLPLALVAVMAVARWRLPF